MVDTPARKSPLGADAFVGSGAVEVEVPYKDGKITLLVKEIGWSEHQMCLARAYKAGDDNAMPYLIAASVSDKEGNTFTVDEAKRLKREAAEPLIEQVLKFQGIDVKDGKIVPKP